MADDTPKPGGELRAETATVYERNARRFDAERQRTLFERPWLDRFRKALPDGAAVLDLGCGTGEPIGAYLTGRGYKVTGVDASEAMLAVARARVPGGDWRRQDMRALDLPIRFDGIVGWNSFFHLTADEQRATLPRIVRHLAPGGSLMLTVGPEAGEVVGRVGDDWVFHASLAPAEYGAILRGLGVMIEAFAPNDPECRGHTILLARRRREVR